MNLASPEGARMYDEVARAASLSREEFLRLSGDGLFLVQIPLAQGRRASLSESTTGEVDPDLTQGIRTDALLALQRSREVGQALVHRVGSTAVVVLGRKRDACDLVLPFDGVSRQHAELRPSAEGWSILDLGSRNGTFVDEVRIPPAVPVPVEEQTLLQLGAYRAVVMTPGPFHDLASRLRASRSLSGRHSPGVDPLLPRG